MKAYVSNNPIKISDYIKILAYVYDAVEAVAQGHASAPAVAEGLVEKPSAAEMRRLVGRDALISVEDGKPTRR
ncbi:MucR family transcriptional regulator [Methylobacterium sp.]|uniref:MucR family transcriptional regulator n=1 Tax=Methylobacterium sp. TaxID=409 RepID=UPI003B006F9A